MAIKTLINILNTVEINSFFGLPLFNDKEQNDYFTLSAEEYDKMIRLSSTTMWYFILQLGYFKARKQFFIIRNLIKVSKDIEFITKLYNCSYPTKAVSEETHQKVRNLILIILNHSGDIKSNFDFLEQKAKTITSTTTNPKLIFKVLYEYAANSKFLIPKYSTFQKIIGKALKSEAERLQDIIVKYLSNTDLKLLDQLLTTTEQYYEITLIKQDQKNFRYAQVQNIIAQKTKYNVLYKSAKKIISKLDITQSMIDYYATMINHYPVVKLKKLRKNTSHLYLICYIYRRMQKLNDNLTSAFIYYVDRYVKLSNEYAHQCFYEAKSRLNKNLSKKLPKLLQLFLDDAIADHEVRLLGLKIIPEKEIKELIAYITKSYVDERNYRWQFFTSKKNKTIKNLRPIFKAISFTCSPTCTNLEEAISFLKTQFVQKEPLSQFDQSDFPLDFIPEHIRPYINNLDNAQYEFCVYDQIRKQFKNNEVTIQDSINNKSLDSDLIPKHKTKSIIKELANPLLNIPFKDSLEAAQKELEELYHFVNQRIVNGDNTSVKIEHRQEKAHIILPYDSKEELTNHDFFRKLTRVNLIDVLEFVHRAIGFLNAFTHIKPHYSKAIKDDKFILAVILANGLHHGINKMASMSDLDYQSLFTAEHNFVRLETLKLANDLICDAIFQLAIFKHWNIEPDLLYGGADGQKFVTKIEIVSARNSAKYFPLKKGISAYTLLANYVPLSVETISPNLHESYFLFDIAKNISANIKLDYISGDDHSINPVNFLLNRYIPVGFAPHLVNINAKIKNLCSFEHPNRFKDLLIKPHKQTKSDLILEEENNIKRAIASLLKGEVKQSIIIRKLSSLSKYDRTCKAMAEYDNVYESMYTLNFIDKPKLRQAVRGTLNRTEAYHQMRRAIAIGNNGEFRGNSELELEIWNQSARLLANVIIYYNACLLSAALKKYQNSGADLKTIDTIKRISPLAWSHINMVGRLEFLVNTRDIDIDEMIANAELF